LKLDYSSESKQEFSAAKIVVMTDQEIGFGSMRESNFVAHECGGSFGNFSGDGSFSNGDFCRITVNGGFFLS
jgi:hypothetical protein